MQQPSKRVFLGFIRITYFECLISTIVYQMLRYVNVAPVGGQV
jgi:hypothetical protein